MYDDMSDEPGTDDIEDEETDEEMPDLLAS